MVLFSNRGNIKNIIKTYFDGWDYYTSRTDLYYSTTGWKDQLISVNIDGTTYYISEYDVKGNPKNFFGYTITYNQRAITELKKGINTYKYNYNAFGIRIQKNINNVITNYLVEDSRILQETRTGVTLKYYYDSNNEIIGFTYNGTVYTYIKNLQKDIIAIADASGIIKVKYFYDAYGNITNQYDYSGIGLANSNPFRFKSYYYDNETKFYYLNSRYYDPSIGRFINADNVNMLINGETNLYQYCRNNPIMLTDENGYNPTRLTLNLIFSEQGSFGFGGAFVATTISLSAIIGVLDRDVLDRAGGVVGDIADSIKNKIKNFSITLLALSSALTNAKVQRYKTTQTHHIVAQNDWRAEFSRQILTDVNIDIDDQINKVELDYHFHKKLHTNLYYLWINTVISMAYWSGSNDYERRANVINALKLIKNSLQIGNLPYLL